MDKGYLLDSNVIIGYLAARIPASGMEIVSALVDQIPNISVISQIEILRYNDTPENEAILNAFIILVTRNVEDFKDISGLELLNQR